MEKYDVDKITQYLEKFRVTESPTYTWEFEPDSLNKLNILSHNEIDSLNKNSKYEQALLLRELIQKKLNDFKTSDQAKFNNLCLWIIKDWGQIRGGDDGKILNLVDKFLKDKILNFERIASISKVASFLNPEEYFIYDSRVVHSLNWIILSENAGNKFFPAPEGRNSKMKAFDMDVLIRLKNIDKYKPSGVEELKKKYISNKDNELYISKSEAYDSMKQLMNNISSKLWISNKSKRLINTEMLLFSIADKEVFNDITNRTNISIDNEKTI